ncbi:bifunctional DNA primase/polymerase [Pseudarthrobacter scleromae]|uniref:bifunctional DNA primase/polymerase n=1 Tax=Pseudarthrobacter scleromae TaxID=158897 RepID=UPI003D070C30
MLELALDYASKGYRVFPLWPDGKNPLIGKAGGGSGFKDATTDPDQVQAWWTKTPRANIGIAAGLSGLIIPDLDVKKGDDGPGNYRQLLSEHGLNPTDLEPVVVTTASGGFHHYYRGVPVPDRTKIRVGVDLRSDGGYVVAPGSVVNGKRYVGDLPHVEDLPVAPEALRELLVQEHGQEVASGGVQATGRETLAELLQFPVSEGSRNDWLAKVAGHYAKAGLKFEDYAFHVYEANQRCTPPQPDEDVAGVVDSIWRREREKADPQSDAFLSEVEQELRRLRVRRDAQRRLAEEGIQGTTEAGMFVAGGAFMFDIPDGTPAVWGEGRKVLWAEGEAMMLVGPTGVGKTTLAGQVVRARLGLGSGQVLGMPVAPTKSKVLYLAMDRPQQIARSLRRHFDRSEREVVDERLVVRQGPPPKDVARNPETLIELAIEVGADTVVIDSVKDAAVGLSTDEVGAGYNRARQMLLARGIEVLELHHQKKAHSDGSKPNDLNGVYGSAWIVGGAGSVVLLWGEAGDLDLELIHLKQPAEPVGPWSIRNDHVAGTTVRIEGADPLALLAQAADEGLTAAELSEEMGRDPKSEKDKQRSRRDLDRLVSDGLATKGQEQRGPQRAMVWRATPESAGRLL